MAAHTKPQPWALSPELTEAPELWRDVAHIFPFWSGGSAFNPVDRYRYDVVGSPQGIGPEAVQFTKASGDGFTKQVGTLSPETPLSLFVYWRFDSAHTGFERACEIYTSYARLGFAIFSGSTTKTRPVYIRSSGGDSGGEIGNVSANEWDTGVWGTQTFIHEGAPFGSTAPASVYKDGVLVESKNLGGQTANDPSDFIIGREFASASDAMNVTMGFACMWHRALSEVERVTLENDPYAMLRPRQDLFSAPVLLGGAETSGGGGGGSGGGGGIGTGSPQVNVIL